MHAQGDAWGAFRALGVKGSLVVLAVFGLPFSDAVADYAAACGIDVPEDSPWAIGTTAG